MIVEYELWVGDCMEASVSGPEDTAYKEIMYYFNQYKDDGPTTIFKVTRELVFTNDPDWNED